MEGASVEKNLKPDARDYQELATGASRKSLVLSVTFHVNLKQCVAASDTVSERLRSWF